MKLINELEREWDLLGGSSIEARGEAAPDAASAKLKGLGNTPDWRYWAIISSRGAEMCTRAFSGRTIVESMFSLENPPRLCVNERLKTDRLDIVESVMDYTQMKEIRTAKTRPSRQKTRSLE